MRNFAGGLMSTLQTVVLQAVERAAKSVAMTGVGVRLRVARLADTV